MGMLYELDFNQQQANILSKQANLINKSATDVTAIVGGQVA